jgi:hypothetical protein
MQLMAAMRYFDRLESEMSRDQFEDLVRKVKLSITTRLRTCASGAALLDAAGQVARYFIFLHIITSQTEDTSFYCILLRLRRKILHFTVFYYALPVFIMNFGVIHTFSGRRRL